MPIRQLVADGDTTTPAAASTLGETPALYRPDRFTGNAYLATGERPTLVDTGRLPGLVETIEHWTGSLEAVVLTHQHGDHVAQLDAVLEAYDPAVYAYADHPARTHPVGDGETILLGDDRYEAIHTPGHAPDHLALVSGRAMFSGDVAVHNDEAFEGGSFGGTGGPGPARDELIGSLGTLLDRLPSGVEAMYPGHGDVFQGDVRAVIEAALERARRRDPKYD